MNRRVTCAMSTSQHSRNPNHHITDSPNPLVTHSLLDASTPSSMSASTPSSMSASAIVSTSSSNFISGSDSSSIIASASTSSSVPTYILQCVLDVLTTQQQQFDKQCDLLETWVLAQQRRDAHLLRQLQLINQPQIIQSATNFFDAFVSASSPTLVPA